MQTKIEDIPRYIKDVVKFWHLHHQYDDEHDPVDFLSYIFSVSEEYKDYTFDYDDMAG